MTHPPGFAAFRRFMNGPGPVASNWLAVWHGLSQSVRDNWLAVELEGYQAEAYRRKKQEDDTAERPESFFFHPSRVSGTFTCGVCGAAPGESCTSPNLHNYQTRISTAERPEPTCISTAERPEPTCIAGHGPHCPCVAYR